METNAKIDDGGTGDTTHINSSGGQPLRTTGTTGVHGRANGFFILLSKFGPSATNVFIQTFLLLSGTTSPQGNKTQHPDNPAGTQGQAP
uniref:Uncharacterized protein n=1 Tax=Romanomermis culicivorax TaxID=13658 RepID=A0A915J7V9_ROMCU